MGRLTGTHSISIRLIVTFAACWLAAAVLCAAEGNDPHTPRPAARIAAASRDEPSIHEATAAGRTLRPSGAERHPDYKEHVDPLAEIREALRRTELHEPFREHACGQSPHFSFEQAGCINPRPDAVIPNFGAQCHRHSRAPPFRA